MQYASRGSGGAPINSRRESQRTTRTHHASRTVRSIESIMALGLSLRPATDGAAFHRSTCAGELHRLLDGGPTWYARSKWFHDIITVGNSAGIHARSNRSLCVHGDAATPRIGSAFQRDCQSNIGMAERPAALPCRQCCAASASSANGIKPSALMHMHSNSSPHSCHRDGPWISSDFPGGWNESDYNVLSETLDR